MKLVVLPGVFAPISDTRLLGEAVRDHIEPGASTVLELCSGSGAVAISAALAGARTVSAVDVARVAAWNTRLNARLNRVRVEVHRGDLLAPFGGRRFDLIAANPPYVPSLRAQLPRRGLERAWEAGLDGRALLDRICAEAPRHLVPGGVLLVTHSSWCDGDATLTALRAAGLAADVVARVLGPLGPLLSERAAELAARGLVARGTRDEALLVIRGVHVDRSASLHRVTVPVA